MFVPHLWSGLHIHQLLILLFNICNPRDSRCLRALVVPVVSVCLFVFPHFYREKEEDKEMADFLKSKLPRTARKIGMRALIGPPALRAFSVSTCVTAKDLQAAKRGILLKNRLNFFHFSGYCCPEVFKNEAINCKNWGAEATLENMFLSCLARSLII